MEDTKRALAIVASLDWEQWVYDERHPRTYTLSQIVNRLAFEGVRSPSTVVLSLLSAGNLTAWGNYHWRAYDDDGQFSEDGPARIPARRWAELQSILAAATIRAPKNINLDLIELVDVPTRQFEWSNDQAAYAICTGNLFEQGYREEWFSAWDLTIEQPEAEAEAAALEPTQSKGGRTPAYDWERAVAAVALMWGDTAWEPTLQADVEAKLLEWFTGAGKEPAPSSVRPRAKMLFEEIQKIKVAGQ